MVHYDPTYLAIPSPPPICPKCGSHRTEIVGLADDGHTIVVRCNACGARSELKTAPVADQPVAASARKTRRVVEWEYTQP